VDYRISAYELPSTLPEATSMWVGGFLAGSLPRPPDSAWDADGNERPDVMERWRQLAQQFRRTGWWPTSEDETAFFVGDSVLPVPPSSKTRRKTAD
jgi:hypothetical protein